MEGCGSLPTHGELESASIKLEQAKRSYQLARDDYDKANRLLLLELPQFYEKRVDYFQPSLQVGTS